jgi:hypothetical protein
MTLYKHEVDHCHHRITLCSMRMKISIFSLHTRIPSESWRNNQDDDKDRCVTQGLI